MMSITRPSSLLHNQNYLGYVQGHKSPFQVPTEGGSYASL
jgi:hypothetical protein